MKKNLDHLLYRLTCMIVMDEKISQIAISCIDEFAKKYIENLFKEIIDIINNNIIKNPDSSSILHGSYESNKIFLILKVIHYIKYKYKNKIKVLGLFLSVSQPQ